MRAAAGSDVGVDVAFGLGLRIVCSSSASQSAMNPTATSRTGPGWVSISAAIEAKKQPPGKLSASM